MSYPRKAPRPASSYPFEASDFRAGVALQGAERAVVVADYIAGMTDRYALNEVKRVFGG
ncbi:MAG: hypothetical protein ACR65U_06735 [Methylocystis sp.]